LENFNLKPANILEPAKGRLLIADPFMDDPYFRRTVVLICEHNDEGSFGFVLNKYIDVKLEDLVDDLPNIDGRVSLGGPVQNSNLFFIHKLGDAIDESLELSPGLYMGGDFEQLRDKISLGMVHGDTVRFFVGYSGWGEHQLDGEISQESWYVSAPGELNFMDTESNELWELALRNMGAEFARLAHFPADPSLN
jgi:putative transcriptional regulator